MNTILATAALSVMFLSAGAFADRPVAKAPAPEVTNVTVITKNSVWPLKGQITTDSCQYVRCIGI